MQALRWHGVKDLRLETIAEPQATNGKVKIKVEWCGICGSDLHEYVAGLYLYLRIHLIRLQENRLPSLWAMNFPARW